MTGHALIVTSQAFGGKDQTIKPRAPLRHVATLHEDRPPVIFEHLPSDAAMQPGSASGADRDTTPLTKGRNRRMALVLLALVLAALILVAMLT